MLQDVIKRQLILTQLSTEIQNQKQTLAQIQSEIEEKQRLKDAIDLEITTINDTIQWKKSELSRLNRLFSDISIIQKSLKQDVLDNK